MWKRHAWVSGSNSSMPTIIFGNGFGYYTACTHTMFLSPALLRFSRVGHVACLSRPLISEVCWRRNSVRQPPKIVNKPLNLPPYPTDPKQQNFRPDSGHPQPSRHQPSPVHPLDDRLHNPPLGLIRPEIHLREPLGPRCHEGRVQTGRTVRGQDGREGEDLRDQGKPAGFGLRRICRGRRRQMLPEHLPCRRSRGRSRRMLINCRPFPNRTPCEINS